MIIKIGSFQEDAEFSPDKKWVSLREFSIKYFQVRAIPLGIVSLALFTFFWIEFTPVMKYWNTISFPLIIFQNLTILIGVIIIHEFIHALFHPKYGFSKQSVIRIWPEKMFIYTYYLGEITKRRSMLIQIMPLTMLSIIPLIIAVIMQKAPIWLAYMSIVNALIACGDILAIILTMIELPSGAIIRSTGWNGYYRILEK